MAAARGEHGHQQGDRCPGQEPRSGQPPAKTGAQAGLSPHQYVGRGADRGTAEQKQGAEDEAGAETIVVRLLVGDEARLGEAPGGNRDRSRERDDQRRHRFHPPRTNGDEDRHGGEGDDHAASRVGEEQGDGGEEEQHRSSHPEQPRVLPADRKPEAERQREGRDEREPVPVADWVAQPCDPGCVREEVGHDLAQKRPGDHRGDQDREQRGDGSGRLRQGDAEEEPEDSEGEVDEAAVEVLPAAVGSDRPEHRHPVPNHERSKQEDKSLPGPVELRPRKDTAEAEGEGGSGGEQRRGADPGQRRVRGAVTGKEGKRREHARAEENERARRRAGAAYKARVHWRRSYHRRRAAASLTDRLQLN
jgi:hypothetical protein